MSKHKPKFESHVRLYRRELECAAYRDLSPMARALLIEFRAMYCGEVNRVFMGARLMATRLNTGTRQALRARDELVAHGFLRILEKGAFTRKVKHATVYALTNEPLENRDGATAPKDFMRWSQKNTVVESTTDCGQIDHREAAKLNEKRAVGSRIDHREAPKTGFLGSRIDYTDKLSDGIHVLLWAGLRTTGELQAKVALATALLTRAAA